MMLAEGNSWLACPPPRRCAGYSQKIVDRTPVSEISLPLRPEQTGHETTARLFKEERARYERCRESLEKTKEDLADLDQRFNELCSELEVKGHDYSRVSIFAASDLWCISETFTGSRVHRRSSRSSLAPDANMRRAVDEL